MDGWICKLCQVVVADVDPTAISQCLLWTDLVSRRQANYMGIPLPLPRPPVQRLGRRLPLLNEHFLASSGGIQTSSTFNCFLPNEKSSTTAQLGNYKKKKQRIFNFLRPMPRRSWKKSKETPAFGGRNCECSRKLISICQVFDMV